VKEEFETTQYICPRCGYLNPSRRPVTPKALGQRSGGLSPPDSPSPPPLNTLRRTASAADFRRRQDEARRPALDESFESRDSNDEEEDEEDDDGGSGVETIPLVRGRSRDDDDAMDTD